MKRIDNQSINVQAKKLLYSCMKSFKSSKFFHLFPSSQVAVYQLISVLGFPHWRREGDRQEEYRVFSQKLFNKVVTMIIVTFFTLANVNGQQLPRFSQYMMNEFIINPSVAGDDGMTTIGGIARKDWLSFGSGMRTPSNVCISAQTRFLKSALKVKSKKGQNKLKKKSKGRVALGGSIYADNSGAISRTTTQLVYAYHLTLNSSQLSFGLAGTMSQIKFNSEFIEFYDIDNEPMITVANSPTWVPDFNVGINYVTQRYHIGISTLQVLQSPVMFGNSDINYKSTKIGFTRNWNVLGAAFLTPQSNPDWMIEPSFLIKMYGLFNFKEGSYGPRSQVDLSLRFFYDSRYWFGFSYRTLSEFVLMGGVKINKYYFAYAFDYGLNELSYTSFGSHEISLAIKFGDSARRYNWLDRY